MAQDMTPSTKSKQPKATTSTKQANGGNRKRGRPSAGSSATTTTAASISRVNNGAETSSASSTVSTTARATLMEEDQNPLMVQYIPRKDVDATDFSEAFWRHQFGVAENVQEDFKTPELPLARVKRVMKTDPEVSMIASEVPVILEKACQIFIADLTARAYIDSPKRRTLTKIDVARAARQTDMFDFLIDILPREGTTTTSSTSNGNAEHSRRNSLNSQI